MRLVKTRKPHHCCICDRDIPTESSCLSRKRRDPQTGWSTQYFCPGLTCRVEQTAASVTQPAVQRV